MGISAAQVKALRDATGAGMMDCKKALTACDGDLDAAKLHLQKKGIADTKKRAGRVASEGLVVAKISDDGLAGLLLELNCETDFVARTDDFVGIANALGDLALESGAPTVNALAEVTLDGKPVAEQMLAYSAKTGEKLVLRRLTWHRLPEGTQGAIRSYIHTGGRIGVIVGMNTSDAADTGADAFVALGRDLCMHVAASQPQVVSIDDIDADIVAREKEILVAQAAESGKPPEIIERMVTGRLNKWKKELTLLDQPFVKDTEFSVAKWLAKVGKESLSGTPSVTGFVRYLLGEGIEKKESNLADEVAGMLGG